MCKFHRGWTLIVFIFVINLLWLPSSSIMCHLFYSCILFIFKSYLIWFFVCEHICALNVHHGFALCMQKPEEWIRCWEGNYLCSLNTTWIRELRLYSVQNKRWESYTDFLYNCHSTSNKDGFITSKNHSSEALESHSISPTKTEPCSILWFWALEFRGQ